MTGTRLQTIQKQTAALLTAALLLTLAGCGLGGGPRARWGFTPKQYYGDPNNLGTHSYGFGGSEGYGIMYTLRGGTIDPDHLRGVADLTRHTYDKARKTLLKRGKTFRVGPAFEMTTNTVRFDYPPGWDNLPPNEKEKIAHEAALIIAPAVAYFSSIWHEMLTWKGLRFALIEPEHESAFSWDDLYSNALGAKLAAHALRGGPLTTKEYNQAMTELIRGEMDALEVVSRERALEILESVRGTWFTDNKLIKRHMNLGFEDGQITPQPIPGYTDQPPASIPLPTFDGLEQYGLSADYTIHSPYFEAGALRRMAETDDRVRPLIDYPLIMEKIRQEAVEKYDYIID